MSNPYIISTIDNRYNPLPEKSEKNLKYELSKYRKQAIRAAKDFCYGTEVINRIKKAKTSTEISQIMHTARCKND